jgi:ubiquinone/menaquinone biosynthesis C-methylase UbiE
MRLANPMRSVKETPTVRFDFGKIAHRYDAWYQTPRGAMYDRLEKRAIDRLLPSASTGDRLLEMGCGTGHFSEHFASKGFEIRGVDISESMIAVARRKNIKGAKFEVADAEHLPFADHLPGVRIRSRQSGFRDGPLCEARREAHPRGVEPLVWL